jgi:uncharacterized protein
LVRDIHRSTMTPIDLPSCLCERDGRVLLRLSVVPNARRTEVDGLHDGALRVRLAAPPIEGRANAALVAWLAKSLGVPRRDVEVLRGESSRRKQVAIAVSRDHAVRWLAEQLERPA